MPSFLFRRALVPICAVATLTAADPALAVTGPSAVGFGEAKVGEPVTRTLAFVAEHDAGAPGELLGTAALDGPQADEFAIVEDGCSGMTIPASCRIVVALTAISAGAKAASLSLTGADGAASVELTGAGFATGRLLRAEPASVAFGATVPGRVGAIRHVVVRNDGDLPARVGAVYVAASNATDFVLTNPGCGGVTLVPGALCVTTLRFEPRDAGRKQAELVVQCEPACEGARVPLEGTGEMLYGAAPPAYDALALWTLSIRSVRVSRTAVTVAFKSTVPARFSLRLHRGGRTLALVRFKRDAGPATVRIAARGMKKGRSYTLELLGRRGGKSRLQTRRVRR